MLKFIKNLFAKQEIQEEKIGIDGLNGWLDAKTKPMLNDLDIKINETIEKINDEKGKSDENLKTLENAQLQNPKIPERVKAIMQGNREGFIKRVSLFLNNLGFNKTDLKYNDYNELIEKCRGIQNEINNLGRSTAKYYQILNEFFAREAEKVAMNLKSIENYSSELIKIMSNSKISDINKIKSGAIDLKNKIKLKESYSIQLKNSNNSLNDDKNKKTGIESRINEIKSSADYKNYEKLLEEKEKSEIKIKEIENNLLHDFSVLERAMKKYAKISFENEDFILEYMDNPIIELIKDTDFKLLGILDNLKNSIERNELGLEERKKDKPIEKINEVDGVYLAKIRDDFINAGERLNALKAEIESSSSRKALDSLNAELMNANQNIENISSEIANLNNELGKINIEKLREALQKEINDAVKAKITLL